MIKGLYFKLNMDNVTDMSIYNYFIQESKKRNISKIDLLYRLVLTQLTPDQLRKLNGGDKQ